VRISKEGKGKKTAKLSGTSPKKKKEKKVHLVSLHADLLCNEIRKKRKGVFTQRKKGKKKGRKVRLLLGPRFLLLLGEQYRRERGGREKGTVVHGLTGETKLGKKERKRRARGRFLTTWQIQKDEGGGNPKRAFQVTL